MTRRGKLSFVTYVASTLLISVACAGGGSAGGTDDETCAAGSLGCSCFEDRTCDAGLVCAASRCVADTLGTGGSGAASGGSGGSGTGGVGGTSTGGTSTQVSCVGTPSGTCAGPVCDVVLGCTVLTPGSCSGEAAPCSTFDDQIAACQNQWGCSPVTGAGLCDGVSSFCEDIGTAAACDPQPACIWEPAEVNYCAGVAISCDAMLSPDCDSQQGCTLTPAECSGTPTPCAELSPEDCTSQPGCELVGSSGGGGSGGSRGSTVQLPDVIVDRLTAVRETLNDAPVLHFYLEVINRGVVDAPPFSGRVVLTTDEIVGNEDDRHFFNLTQSFVIEPHGLSTIQWGHDYYTMTSIAALHPAGYYRVAVILDTDDEVAESEETNNVAIGPLTFLGFHSFDLEALEVAHDALSTLSPDDALMVGVLVRNASTAEVVSVPIRLVLSDDTVLDADDVDFCAAEAEVTLAVDQETVVDVACSVPRVRGDYYVIAEVDPEDTLADTDRLDNVMASTQLLSVDAPSPDLTIEEVSSGSLSVAWQGDLDVAATVENIGSDPAGAHSVAFLLSEDPVADAADTLLCSVSLPAGVAAGADEIVEDTCSIPADTFGSLWLIAIADRTDVVFETDETNNEATFASQLTVAGPDYNLSAGDLSVGTFTISAGESVQFQLTVANTGSDAIPGYDFGIYLSTDQSPTTADDLFCSVTRGQLAAGTVESVVVECTEPGLDPGTYFASAILDPADELPETDESDNTAVYDLQTVEIVP